MLRKMIRVRRLSQVIKSLSRSKNSPLVRFPPPALLVAYCLGETLTAIQMVQQRAEMPNDTTKIKN
ncbi:putative secreted protein [Enterobacter sp. J49]|nr:putative secreted protein [Enterobacter sp. J49]